MAKKKKSISALTYLEMVSDAIVTLKERNGSSQYAIGKFIGDKYKDLPANFKKMLSNRLKKLVASKKLVKVKASYKLPSIAKIITATKQKGALLAKKKPNAPAKTKAAPAKARPAPKAKPAAKAKPAPKAKPTAKAKPAPKAKPAAKAKRAPKAKPAAKAKRAPKAKRAAKAKLAPKAKPAAKAKPASKAKPAAKAKPVAIAEPIISHQPAQTNRPDELAQPKTTMVTVVAKYKNQLESFSFEVPTQATNRSSERFIMLKEEIATRFQLEQGSFKLKYTDPEDDMIMITCDSSLSLAAKDFTELGHQNVIILMVLPA